MTDSDDAISPEGEAFLEAAAGLILPTLSAWETLRLAARHLDPERIRALVEAVVPAEAPIRAARGNFDRAVWPGQLVALRDGVAAAADLAHRAFDGLRDAARHEDFGTARRALRLYAEACEALWPAVRLSPIVSRFFLDGAARDDDALCARLEEADAEGRDVGVFHFENEFGERGGFSVFVPECHNSASPPPLVAALHGGGGHGRAFLWNWLPAARSAGLILVAPTSAGRTWALQGEDVDTPNLNQVLTLVRERWGFDERRVLLTGMSDGGTFCWTSGFLGDSPFTHLAPFSASFHPLLLEFAEADRMRGLPVHIVHGALDWMFPPEIARTAAHVLKARGARVTHREIPDLSHTFATDETAAVIDWFLKTPTVG